MTRIAYVVHDLNDPAVTRRVRMLRAAGGDPVVMGFWRGDRPPQDIGGAPVVDLGKTADARLLQRGLSVLRNLLRPAPMLAAARGAEIVIGRNLEALVLAARIKRDLPGARLVFECLDIHRSLLGNTLAHRAIQAIEARLLRSIDLLLISSPAFYREYFAHRRTMTAPVLLVENKLLVLDGPEPVPVMTTPGPPWTIGWFGNLRCRKTLAVLRDFAARHGGKVEILIAGRPTTAVFADFAAEVATVPHCTYMGPYTPADLPALYARCHFAWAIDYFEEGQNSQWLLPNRLYEASAFGAVPVALASVEVGRWLANHGAGVLLNEGLSDMDGKLALLGQGDYAALRDAVRAIPHAALLAGPEDCATLMRALAYDQK